MTKPQLEMSDSTNLGSKEIHYIPCGGMTIAYVTENGQVGKFYTLYTDHLGSVVTVTNEANAVIYEQNFDACLSVRSAAKAEDRKRNPQTWETLQLPITENTNFSWVRGFTGHEMLRAFNLVNMNNRMYDPVVGRMLAVDNYVQAPGSTQSYNRYSYCWNNPLKYTDPSGEIVGLTVLTAIYVGAVINTAIQASQGNVDNFGQFAISMAVGGVAGGLSAITGGAVAGALGSVGFIAGATTGFASGFVSGFVGGAGNAWVNGARFDDGLRIGFRNGLIGGATSALIGGTVSGIKALRLNGNFFTGKNAVSYSLASESSLGEVGKKVEYNQENANAMKEKYFSKVRKVDNLISNGKLGPRESYNIDGAVINDKKQVVLGATYYNGIGKGSDVYLYPGAFSSREQLYLTMGHEFLHAGYNGRGLSDLDREHKAIYGWELQQRGKWIFDVDTGIAKITQPELIGVSPYPLNAVDNVNYVGIIDYRP